MYTMHTSTFQKAHNEPVEPYEKNVGRSNVPSRMSMTRRGQICATPGQNCDIRRTTTNAEVASATRGAVNDGAERMVLSGAEHFEAKSYMYMYIDVHAEVYWLRY